MILFYKILIHIWVWIKPFHENDVPTLMKELEEEDTNDNTTTEFDPTNIIINHHADTTKPTYTPTIFEPSNQPN